MARKRFFRGGRQVRETMWITLDATSTNFASASSAALILSLNAGGLALRPFTIVRTRGNWIVRSDQNAVTEFYQVGLGVAVVSEQASAIGVTAVPTPFTDLGSDLFMVHQIQAGAIQVASAVGFQNIQSVDYDSKAMRKVNDDQDVVVLLETSSVSLGATVLHGGRMLIKLH